MLSRFHLIPECYGQTDGQTDRFAISISRVSILTRVQHIWACVGCRWGYRPVCRNYQRALFTTTFASKILGLRPYLEPFKSYKALKFTTVIKAQKCNMWKNKCFLWGLTPHAIHFEEFCSRATYIPFLTVCLCLEPFKSYKAVNVSEWPKIVKNSTYLAL